MPPLIGRMGKVSLIPQQPRREPRALGILRIFLDLLLNDGKGPTRERRFSSAAGTYCPRPFKMALEWPLPRAERAAASAGAEEIGPRCPRCQNQANQRRADSPSRS